MGDVTTWAPTAAGNNLNPPGPPDYPSENQARSTLNNCIRENMSAVRRLADDGGWFDRGHTYAYVGPAAFQAQDGDFTAIYLDGRRVRAVGSTTGTVYGTVLLATFNTPHTDVTLFLDDGATLQNEALTISIGPDPRGLNSPYSIGELKELAYAVDIADWPGWLECGQAVSRTTYAQLFSLLGTTWGAGDGSTTFDLPPNARATIAAGTDGGSTYTVGQKLGAETHTLAIGEMPAHTHTQNIVTTPFQSESAPGQQLYQPGAGGIQTGSAGGGAAHNNMQPSMVVSRIIYAGA